MSAADHGTAPIRVLLADPQSRVPTALAALLSTFDDLRVVAVASDADDAVRLTEALRPDVVLVDVTMSYVRAIDVTHRLKAAGMVPVVWLTIQATLEGQALAAGADAWLVKGVTGDEIVGAIRRLHAQAAQDSTTNEGYSAAGRGPAPAA